jgi:hypothetical protein
MHIVRAAQAKTPPPVRAARWRELSEKCHGIGSLPARDLHLCGRLWRRER